MQRSQTQARRPWNAWLRSTGLAALALGCHALLTAQEAGNTDLAQLKALDPEQLLKVEVATVYGASRHEESVLEAPSDVSIVTTEDIRSSGYRTLAEILDGVGGFYTTSDGVYDYVGTRGFNRPGDYGGRILITIDGHRMNDDIFGSASIGTEFLLDVDLIDRVEVIRGPGSSLYGNNAVLAVINVVTKTGQSFSGTELSGAYASYDTYTGRITYGNHFENGLRLSVSASYLKSAGDDSLYYPAYSDINHGRAPYNGADRAPNFFASASYGDLSLEGGYVQRPRTIPAAYTDAFGDAQASVMDERAFADLKLQHPFAGEWKLTTRIYYDQYHYVGDYALPGIPYGSPLYPGQVTINSDNDHQESVGSEATFDKTFLAQHRVTFGAEYRYDFTLEQRNFDVGGPTYLDSNITQETVGAYFQDEYAIAHDLILNAGARYDHFSSFGDTTNPRLALIYSPVQDSTFKAIYGQAFRAPNAYELYYEAPGYMFTPRLKPETIRSYEFDFDQALGPHLQFTSSLFYYKVRDLISFGLDSQGDSSFGNLASATSKGAQVELDGTWAGGWHGKLSYTYADARDSATGQRLTDSPEHVAKLNLTAPLPARKTTANMEILSLSDRTTVQGNTLGSYWLFNFTLLSREISKGLDVSASVYNAFDRRYSDPVGSDFQEDAAPRNGRQFRVKLTQRY